jgi:multiple sugar transport system substrate-binding protein/sorbitol/mannitol transport system substrate-binding protein
LTALDSDAFNSRYGAFKDAMIAAINQGNPQYFPVIEATNEIVNNTGIAVSQALAGTAAAADALAAADEANNAAIAR